jgi:hypothetical protein
MEHIFLRKSAELIKCSEVILEDNPYTKRILVDLNDVLFLNGSGVFGDWRLEKKIEVKIKYSSISGNNKSFDPKTGLYVYIKDRNYTGDYFFIPTAKYEEALANIEYTLEKELTCYADWEEYKANKKSSKSTL